MFKIRYRNINLPSEMLLFTLVFSIIRYFVFISSIRLLYKTVVVSTNHFCRIGLTGSGVCIVNRQRHGFRTDKIKVIISILKTHVIINCASCTQKIQDVVMNHCKVCIRSSADSVQCSHKCIPEIRSSNINSKAAYPGFRKFYVFVVGFINCTVNG